VERTFYLESLGCAKNQVDSEVMISVLEDAGWIHVESPGDSSVIIVNTCGFIQPAKEESIQVALQFHNDFREQKIVMAGCLAQRYAEDLSQGMPEIDGFFGNRAPELIGEFLDRVLDEPGQVFLPVATNSPPLRKRLLSLPGSAYVKIAEGCNNRCAFCAIPLIRGNLRSRPIDSVMREIEDLLRRGIFEINLVAHDLNSFGRDRTQSGRRSAGELPALLRRISELPGDFWIRLLYLYPETFPTDLLPLLAADERLLPYFDLPMQHGSAEILQAMGRSGRRETFLRLLDTVRSALPDAVIRSTFLTGYPGENDRDFEDLLSFQQEAQFDWLGVFTYSPEEGTRGYREQRERGRVPVGVARERKTEIERRQTLISERLLGRFAGRTMRVLVEEDVKGEALSFARAYLQAPEVDGTVVVRGARVGPGGTETVKIIRCNGLDLEAIPVP
jgi:ribosomal protein S12 methylthiotransferase